MNEVKFFFKYTEKLGLCVQYSAPGSSYFQYASLRCSHFTQIPSFLSVFSEVYCKYTIFYYTPLQFIISNFRSMYLSDRDIRQAVTDGTITLSDFDESRINPASYDILLGNKFMTVREHSTPCIDPAKKILPEYDECIIPDGEAFILHPGTTVLGISHDYFGSDDYLIQLSGKSSLARIGLIVHTTAGLINPGDYLHIVFELCNLNSVPIVLQPKMPIAQLIFAEMTSKPLRDYKETGRYHGKNWAAYVPKEEV